MPRDSGKLPTAHVMAHVAQVRSLSGHYTTQKGQAMKDTMELLTDALLDMRSEAIAKRAAQEAAAALEPLTVWTVARIAPKPFELGGVRALPHGTGDTTKAFPDQCSRVSELVRISREWNGKARAGYSNVTTYRKVRQSRARRLLARSA